MSRKTLGAALAALALIGIAIPALAQASDLADLQMERLLRQILTKDAPTADPVLINRAATIRVLGTVRRTSAVRLPLICDAFISDQRSHNEEKTGPVVFNGNVGTCRIDIPFLWQNTVKDGEVFVSVSVTNELQETVTESSATASNILRSNFLSLADIPLPVQGSLVQVTFDTRL